LVAYDTNGAVWASNTGGHPGTVLSLQSDGNLVAFDGNRPVWSTGTAFIDDPVCGRLEPGQEMRVDQPITCVNGVKLLLQADGNVVLCHGSKGVWATNTGGKSTRIFAMQGDGNLVAYDANSRPVWASDTGGKPNTSLVLRKDGNLSCNRAEAVSLAVLSRCPRSMTPVLSSFRRPAPRLEPNTRESDRAKIAYAIGGMHEWNRARWADAVNDLAGGGT
jgi:hypothetical protein